MEHQHTLSTPAAGNVSTDAVAKGYEPHDIGLRGVILFIAGLTVTLVVVLAFVYAIMMALADHDRSHDAIASPMTVPVAPVYAPLQPSLGFNGQHELDHNVLAPEDMLLMREVTAKALSEEGVTASGRHYIPIDAAINMVITKSLLVSKPALAAVAEPTYPPGSHEGVYGSIPKSDIPANVHVNDMNSLNPGDGN